ncbi:MAG: hypothetical protein ACKVS9_14905 [Phycisphaerae bacterium]
MRTVAVICAFLVCTLARAQQVDKPVSTPAITEVQTLPVRNEPLAVELDSSVIDTRGGRLLVASDTEPIGWLVPRASPNANDGEATRLFESLDGRVRAAALEYSRTWLVRPAIYAGACGTWPRGVELSAAIVTIGPGQSGAWIAAGAAHGIQSGDSFWLRRFGQPLARFDVRFAADELSFCRRTPLASGLDLVGEQAATLWPAPADRAAGLVRSAVSLVEPGEGDSWVWVARPVQLDGLPAEPRIEFWRSGQYVGFGIAERRDSRFWYVRLLRAACTDTPVVGDEAIVRTAAMVRERSFHTRVFASAAEGFLISAGETDQIGVGDEATILRSGSAIGTTKVCKVQGGYAVVFDLPPRDGGERIQLLDEVSFGRTTTTTRPVAVVERVVDRDLLSLRLIDPFARPQRLYALRSGDRTIGTGLIIMASEERAVGMALVQSLSDVVRPGAQLVAEE